MGMLEVWLKWVDYTSPGAGVPHTARDEGVIPPSYIATAGVPASGQVEFVAEHDGRKDPLSEDRRSRDPRHDRLRGRFVRCVSRHRSQSTDAHPRRSSQADPEPERPDGRRRATRRASARGRGPAGEEGGPLGWLPHGVQLRPGRGTIRRSHPPAPARGSTPRLAAGMTHLRPLRSTLTLLLRVAW